MIKFSDINMDVLAEGLQFPEGPAFAEDGSLWCVELKGGSLLQFKKGVFKRFHVDGRPNGIAIDRMGVIWFCDSGLNAVRTFDPKTEMTNVMVSHVEGALLAEPNDLAFDRIGNLLFTCPGNSRAEATGYVCVLQKNGIVKKIIKDKYFPNGLAFTEDGKQLVLAETYKHRIWIGDWDEEKAECRNLRVLAETGGPIGPDGLAFSQNGDLYVAVYGSGKIKVVNTSGEIIKEVLLPGNHPTNCAFDPSGELGLVVTEAENGLLLSFKNKY